MWKSNCLIKKLLCSYHPRRREKRAAGAEGKRSPRASIPASTPVTIDATAAHVDKTIALPCFRPRVCSEGKHKSVWSVNFSTHTGSFKNEMDLVPPKIKPNGKSTRHVYAFDGARTENKIALFFFWDERDKQKSLQIRTSKIWKASSTWIKSQ